MKALKGAADDADAETPDMVAAAVREAMNEDMEKALAKDRRAFDRKFDGIQETLEEMKNVVTRSSDRILSAIDSGPHDRIIDKVRAVVSRDSRVLTRSRTYTMSGRRWCVCSESHALFFTPRRRGAAA